jgi:hypothetical protein
MYFPAKGQIGESRREVLELSVIIRQNEDSF